MSRIPLVLLLLSCIIGVARPAAAEVVTGVVFLDENTNGYRDAGEKGLAGVPVTNGQRFSLTEREGTFTIELVRDSVLRDGGTPMVSLRIPDGHWPTTPWFRRVPTPADGAGIVFGLRCDKQVLPMTFIHGTDPHVPRRGESRFLAFRRDVAALADRVRFCVLTGDLVDLADSHAFDQASREYEFLAEQTRGFPVPLFLLPGNHDIAGIHAEDKWDPTSPYYGYGFFTYRVGPLRWSFTYAGVHFVGVDFNRLDQGDWAWGVPESAVRWLEADLSLVEAGTRIFLFVHFPVGVDAFREVVDRFGVTQIFHGHDHVDRSGWFGKVPRLSSGSLAEVFSDKDRLPGYRLVHVTETGIETFYRATGDRHAITVDAPRAGTTFKPGDALRGAFFDPAAQIEQLTVRVGEHQQRIPFERGPICCRFEAELDLTSVTAGIRPITVSVTGGGEQRSVELSTLVLSSRFAPFEAQGNPMLEIDVGGIDRAVEVRVNGAALTRLEPTVLQGDGDFPTPVKGTEVRSVALPRAQVRRLNRIELCPVLGDGGNRDRFCVVDLRIQCKTRKYRDTRFRISTARPLYVGDKVEFWVDLMPGE